MQQPSPEQRIGARLDGKYLLRRICGQGGMGVLYEGEHVWTGRRVAVKLLHERRDRNGESLARFLKEARTAASLRHPNVVDILDMGADGTSPFLVMELLEGESLEELVARTSKLSPQTCLSLLLPVLDAVAVAHDAGIVHRDLKPANIFLSRSPSGAVVPKLVDFGIAEEAHTEGALSDLVLGTPAYMSPEQARGKPVGKETDVWALGVVLYRCLGGALPFSGESPAVVLSEVVASRPLPLMERDPSLPPRLCAAVERALAPDPSARYPDTRELSRALVTTARASGIEVSLPNPEPTSSPDLGLLESGRTSVPSSGNTTAELPVRSGERAPNDSGSSEMAVEGRRSARREASGVGARLAFVAAAGALAYLGARVVTPPDGRAGERMEHPSASAGEVTHVASAVASPETVASAAPEPAPAPLPVTREDEAPRKAAPDRPVSRRPKAPTVVSAPAASALASPARSVPKIRTEW